MMMWSWLVVSRVSRLVQDLRDGDTTDLEFSNEDGSKLGVSEAVSHACSPDGLNFPREDSQMLAVLVRDGVPVDIENPPYGALVETVNGRLGLVTNGGLIESHGDGMSVVEREPGRWVRGWLIPGVAYFGRAGI